MHVALLMTVALLGVDYGWQPGEDGQLEYIIQIEPELVETLKEGKVDLLSEIPEELHGVKRFRIRVGKGPVPQKGLEEARASGALKPDNNAANQQPMLPGDPRARNAANKGGGNFQNVNQQQPGSQLPNGQPGSKVLNPPGPLNLGDPPLPDSNDRFTGNNGNVNTFPAVGRTPGINRNASLPTNQPSGLNNQQPNNNQFNNAPAGNFNNPNGGNVPVNNGAFQQPNTNDRFAADATNRWQNENDPRNQNPNLNVDPGMGPVYDPRYRNQNNTLPEIRRDATDPRYAAAPYRDPRNDPYDPRTQPLRDPDYRYGPDPRDYAYNAPLNRQVDYREVASTRGAAVGTPPPGATAGAPTTPTTPTSNTNPPAASINKSDASNRLADDPNNRPWWPLMFTAMLLFASVGLNIYLGWIANGIYIRYRALLMEVRNVRAAVA